MSDEKTSNSAIEVGVRVSFPYGGSRRTGTVTDIQPMPDGKGSTSLGYLIEIAGQRKVFVTGEGITPAGEEGATAFDPVAEGVAYGRKRPRNTKRR